MERELKLESVMIYIKAKFRLLLIGTWGNTQGLKWEPFRINLDLSFGINFTSEFCPTIKNQALEFDHEPTVLAKAK